MIFALFSFHRILLVVCACLLDFVIGDPSFLPHPVVFMGKLIKFSEKLLRHLFPKNPKSELVAGFFLWLIVVLISSAFPFFVIFFLRKISIIASFALEVFWASQCIAARCLAKEAKNVAFSLNKSIDEGRKAVSRIVGRDTERLDEAGVIRACVETVAENTTDGIISPLFFLILFGTAGAFFYKAANTLDSMVAYKNEKYLYFGRFSARADDVLNFVPARLAALFMILASFFLRFNAKNALRIFLRDRYKHSSPNSAQTESVAAGALGVRLAGSAYYEGKLEEKEFIGDSLRVIEKSDIDKTLRLMWLTYVLFLFTYVLFRFLPYASYLLLVSAIEYFL